MSVSFRYAIFCANFAHHAGMEEHQLKELAYTIFFGACGKRSNAEHVQVMRAQLEVSRSQIMTAQASMLICMPYVQLVSQGRHRQHALHQFTSMRTLHIGRLSL